MTGIAKVAFADQAAGSLVVRDGKVVGSTLIGQTFTRPEALLGPSVGHLPDADNAGSSGGSNLGPPNPALVDAVKGRIAALRAADPDNTQPVPVDLVTASASGLDPEISVAAAHYQAARVANARGLPVDQGRGADRRRSPQGRVLGFLGEPRVNVLALNLALDEMHS